MHNRHVRREEAGGAIVQGRDRRYHHLRGPAHPPQPRRSTWRPHDARAPADGGPLRCSAGAAQQPAPSLPQLLLAAAAASAVGFPPRGAGEAEMLQSDRHRLCFDPRPRSASGSNPIADSKDRRSDLEL